MNLAEFSNLNLYFNDLCHMYRENVLWYGNNGQIVTLLRSIIVYEVSREIVMVYTTDGKQHPHRRKITPVI